jgi:hypothetical protein
MSTLGLPPSRMGSTTIGRGRILPGSDGAAAPTPWVEGDENLKKKIRNILTNGLSPTVEEKVNNIFLVCSAREAQKLRAMRAGLCDLYNTLIARR